MQIVLEEDNPRRFFALLEPAKIPPNLPGLEMRNSQEEFPDPMNRKQAIGIESKRLESKASDWNRKQAIGIESKIAYGQFLVFDFDSFRSFVGGNSFQLVALNIHPRTQSLAR